jgi:hypothetical protein
VQQLFEFSRRLDPLMPFDAKHAAQHASLKGELWLRLLCWLQHCEGAFGPPHALCRKAYSTAYINHG